MQQRAARISHSHGVIARRILGLPVAPVTPAPEPAVIAVETDAGLDAAQASKIDPFWIAAPASAVELIARAHSELWTGKVRLGVRADSGDTERLDYTLGLDAERELVGWGFETSAIYSYSETDDNVGRDELIVKARGEREAGERWTLFANTEWSAINYRALTGPGFWASAPAIARCRETLSSGRCAPRQACAISAKWIMAIILKARSICYRTWSCSSATHHAP
ncbi:MAG: DUF481 domain-containing protein [Oceanicaulis sp.]|nr:DUF481 domain-containing protein [Oceanicaulis sp.]